MANKKVLIPSGNGYLFDRNYDTTSYPLIKLFAWGSKLDSNFGFPLVNYEDYKFGSIPILRNMDIKFVIYYDHRDIVAFPNGYGKAGCDLDSSDVRFLKSTFDDDEDDDTSDLRKAVMDFRHQIEHFQVTNTWDISMKCYNVFTDEYVDETDFNHIYQFGRIIIDDDISITVDFGQFKYNWDYDREDGFKRFKWFMDRISGHENGVNGIMPSSLCTMYADMRWYSGKFRLPYIAQCKNFRTLNFNSKMEAETYVMAYMRPEMEIYENGKLIQPSKIQIDRLDPEYSDVYAIPFKHFRSFFNGRMRYKCINRSTNRDCYFMESIYPVMVFKFHARASKYGKLNNMFVLMGC